MEASRHVASSAQLKSVVYSRKEWKLQLINGINPAIVDKFMSVPKHRDGDCVIWDGPKLGKMGYGGVCADNLSKLAHRIAYALSHGSQPKNFVIHSCDIPLCVNPAHLSDATLKDNARDRDLRGRSGTIILTESEVLKIRASDESNIELADQYFVSEANIRKIKNRKTWKNI